MIAGHVAVVGELLRLRHRGLALDVEQAAGRGGGADRDQLAGQHGLERLAQVLAPGAVQHHAAAVLHVDRPAVAQGPGRVEHVAHGGRLRPERLAEGLLGVVGVAALEPVLLELLLAHLLGLEEGVHVDEQEVDAPVRVLALQAGQPWGVAVADRAADLADADHQRAAVGVVRELARAAVDVLEGEVRDSLADAVGARVELAGALLEHLAELGGRIRGGLLLRLRGSVGRGRDQRQRQEQGESGERRHGDPPIIGRSRRGASPRGLRTLAQVRRGPSRCRGAGGPRFFRAWPDAARPPLLQWRLLAPTP